MYLKINEKNLKSLDKELANSIKKTLHDKNMDFQDVELLFSVELKDPTKPSKTLIEFERMSQEIQNNAFDLLKNVFSNLKKHASKEALTKTIDSAKNEVDNTKDELQVKVIKLFKKMLLDPDNKMVLFVKSSYVNVNHDVKVGSYSKLPSSIKKLVESNKLQY